MTRSVRKILGSGGSDLSLEIKRPRTHASLVNDSFMMNREDRS